MRLLSSARLVLIASVLLASIEASEARPITPIEDKYEDILDQEMLQRAGNGRGRNPAQGSVRSRLAPNEVAGFLFYLMGELDPEDEGSDLREIADQALDSGQNPEPPGLDRVYAKVLKDIEKDDDKGYRSAISEWAINVAQQFPASMNSIKFFDKILFHVEEMKGIDADAARSRVLVALRDGASSPLATPQFKAAALELLFPFVAHKAAQGERAYEAIHVLEKLPSKRAAAALQYVIDHDPRNRLEATTALIGMKEVPEGFRLARQLLDSGNPEERAAAIEGLSRRSDQGSIDLLAAMVAEGEKADSKSAASERESVLNAYLKGLQKEPKSSGALPTALKYAYKAPFASTRVEAVRILMKLVHKPEASRALADLWRNSGDDGLISLISEAGSSLLEIPELRDLGLSKLEQELTSFGGGGSIEDLLPANQQLFEKLFQTYGKGGKNFFILRYISSRVPRTNAIDLIYRIRERAEAIAGRDGPGLDSNFLAIRERIHNEFQPSVLDETRSYYERVSKNPDYPARAKAELRILINDLETLLRRASGAGLTGSSDLATILREAENAHDLIEKDPAVRSSQFDALESRVQRIFVTLGLPENLPRAGQPLPMGRLMDVVRALHLEGIIKEKRRDEFLAVLKDLKVVSLGDTQKLREFLKHVYAIAQAGLEEKLSWMTSSTDTPEIVSDRVQKGVRASHLLRLSQWIESLGAIIAANGKAVGYEAASEGSRCGTLRVVESPAELERLVSNVQDIVALVSKDAVEITRKNPFGGLVSTTPLTEGSHSVILCRNMKRPCASIPGASAAEIAKIRSLNGKSVRLDVAQGGFAIDAAAPVVEDSSSPIERKKLEADLKVVAVQDDQSDKTTAKPTSIGVKATNYFELTRLLGKNRVQPGAAIPFVHYQQFMAQTGADVVIQGLLMEPYFSKMRKDAAYRTAQLKRLRDKIQASPMPKALLLALRQDFEKRFGGPEGLKRLRFRSSSNSEDLKWFSGAGLYDSAGFTAGKGATTEQIDAGIEASVKAVWASVWSDNAFEGREEVGIDHSTVAMGVLVHPSYSDEEANGVALTGNGKDDKNYRVSVNFGSYAVTNPEMGALPEVYEGPREVAIDAAADPRTQIRSSNVKAGAPVLTPAEAEDLRQQIALIHDRFKEPTEIEFKLMKDPEHKGKRIIQVKQARPYRPNGA